MDEAVKRLAGETLQGGDKGLSFPQPQRQSNYISSLRIIVREGTQPPLWATGDPDGSKYCGEKCWEVSPAIGPYSISSWPRIVWSVTTTFFDVSEPGTMI